MLSLEAQRGPSGPHERSVSSLRVVPEGLIPRTSRTDSSPAVAVHRSFTASWRCSGSRSELPHGGAIGIVTRAVVPVLSFFLPRVFSSEHLEMPPGPLRPWPWLSIRRQLAFGVSLGVRPYAVGVSPFEVCGLRTLFRRGPVVRAVHSGRRYPEMEQRTCRTRRALEAAAPATTCMRARSPCPACISAQRRKDSRGTTSQAAGM